MSLPNVPGLPGIPSPPQPSAGLVLSAAELALTQRAFIRPQRGFGGLVAQVTLKERHSDQLDITDHPVERGAMITDHAFMLPVSVVITCGWSNSPPARGFIANPVQGVLTESPRVLTVQEVYEKLRALMTGREIFDVLTGKRKYKNMMLKSLETETDKETENVLLVTATFREVIIVGTEVVTLGAAVDSTNQASPSITGPTVNAGFKQLQPAPLYNPQAGP